MSQPDNQPNNQQYSKYIRAAMDKSEVAAETVAARSTVRDVPHPFSDRLVHSDGYESAAGTLSELRATLEEKHYSDDLKKRAGIEATALWAADRREGPLGATDAALCRVDAAEERRARYRAATGLQSRRKPKEVKEFVKAWVPISVCDRIEALSKMRGEEYSETVKLVVELGAILMDERAKRYEVAVIEQLLQNARFGREMEAARYLDENSPSLERAYNMVEPYNGAPPAIKLLLSKFPVAS